jgi:lysophospholipase L1-like esterase
MRSSIAIPLASIVSLGLMIGACAKSPAAPSTPRAALGPPPVAPPPAPPPIATYTLYMAFGDSMTEGDVAAGLQAYNPGVTAGYPYQLLQLLSARYKSQTIQMDNEGKGGQQAGADLDRLIGALSASRPQVTILLEGVNDLNSGSSPADTAAEMQVLSQTILRSGSQLLLSTLPPQRVGGSGASAPEKIVPYNQLLVSLAKSLNVPIADIYPVITTPLSDGLLGPDGLHPTALGNQKIAQTFLDKIKSMWEKPGVPAPDVFRILPADE